MDNNALTQKTIVVETASELIILKIANVLAYFKTSDGWVVIKYRKGNSIATIIPIKFLNPADVSDMKRWPSIFGAHINQQLYTKISSTKRGDEKKLLVSFEGVNDSLSLDHTATDDEVTTAIKKLARVV